jgi:O-antigen/teichoic acid export membrane protein
LSIGTAKSILALWPDGRGADPLAGYLARGLSATLVLQLTSRALTFLTMLLLSRALGAAGYGQYAFIMAVLGILGSIATFGMPSVLTREVAALRARHDNAGLKGLVLFSLLFGLFASSISVAVYILLQASPEALSGRASIRADYLAAALLIPLWVLVGNLGGIQQGLKRIVAAQLPAGVIQPLALLLFLVAAYWALENTLTVAQAVTLTAVAGALALAAGAILTLLALRRQVRMRGGLSLHCRRWLAAGFSISLLTILNAVSAHADIMLLGWLAGPEATGLFHVATRNAHLLTSLSVALIIPLGPLVAELHAEGDRAALQRVVRRSTRVVFFLTMPAALAMIVAGQFYLELFGAGFAAAHLALAILAVAQLVNVGAGPVQMLLIMTGHQARIIPAMSCSVLANIVLNLALVPTFGATGAACATAFSIVLWNAALNYEVRRHLGIDPGVLGTAP